MELADIIKFTLKYKYAILSVGVFGTLLGVFIYFYLPERYLATGSLYVTRTIDNRNLEILPQNQPRNIQSDDTFTYEGYYAQQNAVSYTATIIGLTESDVVKSRLLGDLGLHISGDNLRKIGRDINAKKQAPQLVAIQVKGASPEEAISRWSLLTDHLIELSGKLNGRGDPNLVIEKVEGSPVIKKPYSNLALNSLVGFMVGILSGYFILAGYAYYREAVSVNKRK